MKARENLKAVSDAEEDEDEDEEEVNKERKIRWKNSPAYALLKAIANNE